MKTITAFCSNEQKDTKHTLDIDGNGEIILTCVSNVGTEEEPTECGRFVKLPKGTTKEKLKEFIETHRFVNEGQLSVEAMEKQKNELLDSLVDDEEDDG